MYIYKLHIKPRPHWSYLLETRVNNTDVSNNVIMFLTNVFLVRAQLRLQRNFYKIIINQLFPVTQVERGSRIIRYLPFSEMIGVSF